MKMNLRQIVRNQKLSNFDLISLISEKDEEQVRYKDKDGKTQLCHTLNGSALALPRIYASLIENNQTPSGIKIPEVLQPYTGFDIIKK